MTDENNDQDCGEENEMQMIVKDDTVKQKAWTRLDLPLQRELAWQNMALHQGGPGNTVYEIVTTRNILWVCSRSASPTYYINRKADNQSVKDNMWKTLMDWIKNENADVARFWKSNRTSQPFKKRIKNVMCLIDHGLKIIGENDIGTIKEAIPEENNGWSIWEMVFQQIEQKAQQWAQSTQSHIPVPPVEGANEVDENACNTEYDQLFITAGEAKEYHASYKSATKTWQELTTNQRIAAEALEIWNVVEGHCDNFHYHVCKKAISYLQGKQGGKNSLKNDKPHPMMHNFFHDRVNCWKEMTSNVQRELSHSDLYFLVDYLDQCWKHVSGPDDSFGAQQKLLKQAVSSAAAYMANGEITLMPVLCMPTGFEADTKEWFYLCRRIAHECGSKGVMY